MSRKYFSNKQSVVVLEDDKNDDSPNIKLKGYQAPTYSMSRKNSVKVLDTSKSSGHFKSFLKKPTNIHNRNTRLRTAKSNDT